MVDEQNEGQLEIEPCFQHLLEDALYPEWLLLGTMAQELVYSGSCGQKGNGAAGFASMVHRGRSAGAGDIRHPLRYAFGWLRCVEVLAKRDYWRPESRIAG